jgi:hypothetical protein
MFKKNMNVSRLLFIMVLMVCLLVSFSLLLWRRVKENLLIHKNTPTYHIVVAKHKEDVLWLFHMDLDKLYVYDKSGDEHSPFRCLENRGREGTTFLGHIIEYYDNLPDYLILVQGNPFAHMRSEINPRNFQENINKLVEKRPTTSEPLFCDYWEEPSFMYAGLMIQKYHELMFEGKAIETLRYAPGNQYIIPRDQIRKRPKGFYQKLWKMAQKGDHYRDVNDAHYTEKKFDKTEIIGWSLERLFPIIISDKPIRKSFFEQK